MPSAELMSEHSRHGTLGEWVRMARAVSPEANEFLARHDPVEVIGSGSFKTVYRTASELALAVSDGYSWLVRNEIRVLEAIASFGVPVVSVHDMLIAGPIAAYAMDLVEPPEWGGAREFRLLEGGLRRHLVAQASAIADGLAGWEVDDLQCLADRNWNLVVADPQGMASKPGFRVASIRCPSLRLWIPTEVCRA